MLIRTLNDEGMALFQQYVITCRNGGSGAPPLWMLDDDRTSVSMLSSLEVEDRPFTSRYEMGAYLADRLRDLDMQQHMGGKGFWSWLALFWFEQLCPANSAGLRKPSMPYNYILSSDYKHRYRHAIFITWQLVTRYGSAASFLLCNEMRSRGELIEQMMARQDILSLDGVMRLASSLYSDSSTGKFKRGAAARKSGGCVSRYVVWLQQLELTYDLYSISEAELEGLLPKEFERFRTKPASAGVT
jgi:hypothetical protein